MSVRYKRVTSLKRVPKVVVYTSTNHLVIFVVIGISSYFTRTPKYFQLLWFRNSDQVGTSTKRNQEPGMDGLELHGD